jgi:hypothetical protein
MKPHLFSTLFLTLVALAPNAIAAQNAPKPAPEASEQKSARYVSIAKGAGDDFFMGGGKPAKPDPNPRAQADGLLAELASIERSIDVDRRFAEAQKTLQELWVRAATKQDYAGRFEVLERVALLRSRLFEVQGNADAARSALEQLLPGSAEQQALGGKLELQLADPSLLGLETTALASSTLTAARNRLIARPDTARGPADQGIDAVVRLALTSHASPTIFDLGARAAPALEQIVIATPEVLPVDRNDDALSLLARVACDRAGRLVEEHLDLGGYVWRKRIMRTLNEDVLRQSGNWQHEARPDGTNRLRSDAWWNLVERFATTPSPDADWLDMISEVAGYNALSTAIQDTLARCLETDNLTNRAQLLAIIQHRGMLSTLRPLVERGIRSGDADVRYACAAALASDGPSELLSSLADDPDARVRIEVVKAFAENEIRPNQLDLLRRLARDKNATVRSRLAGLDLRDKATLPAEIELVLAEDSSPAVLSQLSDRMSPDSPAFPTLLESLARVPDDTMYHTDSRYQYCMSRFVAAQRADQPVWTWIDAVLPAIERRVATIEQPKPGVPDLLGSDLTAALSSEQGMRRISAVVAQRDEAFLWRAWLFAIPFAKDQVVPPGVRAIDPEHLEHALRVALASDLSSLEELAKIASFAAFGAPPTTQARQSVEPSDDKRALTQLKAWRAIALDASLEPAARLDAASVAVIDSDTELEQALLALLTEVMTLEPRTTHQAGAVGSTRWRLIGEHFIPERIEPFLLTALSTGTTAQPLALRDLVGGADEQRALTERVAIRALELACAMPVGNELTWGSLFVHLTPSADAEHVALLAKAVRIPELSPAAIGYVRRVKSEVYLPLLAECLDASWIRHSGARSSVQIAASKAITSLMSEAAAEHLLRGVTLAVSEEARQACLAGLEQIRQYLTEKQRWTVRSTDAEKRELAIQELLKLLGDSDEHTRAQAARSLATLNATEQLPQLIQLLKDRSREVRQAAQQAIDDLSTRKKDE